MLSPRTSLAPRSGVDERLRRGVVGKRRGRSMNVTAEKSVKVRREGVASRVNIDGWGESLDVYGLFYTPFDPILFI